MLQSRTIPEFFPTMSLLLLTDTTLLPPFVRAFNISSTRVQPRARCAIRRVHSFHVPERSRGGPGRQGLLRG